MRRLLATIAPQPTTADRPLARSETTVEVQDGRVVVRMVSAQGEVVMSCDPDRARWLGIELLRVADEAEGL